MFDVSWLFITVTSLYKHHPINWVPYNYDIFLSLGNIHTVLEFIPYGWTWVEYVQPPIEIGIFPIVFFLGGVGLTGIPLAKNLSRLDIHSLHSSQARA